MREPLATQYARAVLPDRFRCLGQWLQPLSIIHALALERLGNPCLTGGVVPRPAELAAAVAVCRVKPQDVHRTLAASPLRWKATLWRLGLRAAWDLRSRLTWSAYLAASLRAPRRWSAGGEPPTAPLWLMLQHQLIRLGFSREESLHISFVEALWICNAEWERAGGGAFVTDAEEDLWADAHAVIVPHPTEAT